MPGVTPPPLRLTARDAGNLLAAAALLGFFVILGLGMVEEGRDQDFLNMYTGAVLAREGRFSELHDPTAQWAVERAVVPDKEKLVPFVRPHVYAALLAPLARLPHHEAFKVWLAAQSLFLVAFLYFVWREFGSDAVVLGAMFAPPILGLLSGQDNWMLGLVVMAGLSLLLRGKDLQGGLLWSLALLKFHLAPGLALALLAGRRTKALAGFAAGGIALAATSVALAGREGVSCYWRMLSNPATEGLYPALDKLPNLQGLAAFAGVPAAWAYCTLGVAVAAVAVLGAWKAEWWKQAVLAAGAWMVLAPHVYFYDLTVLLPMILLSAARARARSTRAAVYFMLNPLLIIFILLFESLQAQFVPVLLVWLWLVSRERAPECPPAAAPRPAGERLEYARQ